MGAQNAKSDLENYRQGYPDEIDDPRQNENLRFYKGLRKSVPDGDYIDEIHRTWKGNYNLLEVHHGYIQWIFPIREHGMNMKSQKLQPHEAEAIKADPACQERVLKSYEMMLDFYGMRLKNPTTGELERTEGYKPRYYNLNMSGHNNLRITRILKSLGELGFEHLKFKFLEFVATEVWVHGELKFTRQSLEQYWTGTLKDDGERARMEKLIAGFKEANGEKDRGHIENRFGPRVQGYSRGGGQAAKASPQHVGARPVYSSRSAFEEEDEEEELFSTSRRGQSKSDSDDDDDPSDKRTKVFEEEEEEESDAETKEEGEEEEEEGQSQQQLLLMESQCSQEGDEVVVVSHRRGKADDDDKDDDDDDDKDGDEKDHRAFDKSEVAAAESDGSQEEIAEEEVEV